MKFRRDANHNKIVDGLLSRGIRVKDLSKNGTGLPDILAFKFVPVFIEIKYGPDARLKRTQIEFMSEWPGHVGIARTLEEAYNLVTDPEQFALTEKQKNRLAVYLNGMTGTQVMITTIEKYMNIGGSNAR